MSSEPGQNASQKVASAPSGEKAKPRSVRCKGRHRTYSGCDNLSREVHDSIMSRRNSTEGLFTCSCQRSGLSR